MDRKTFLERYNDASTIVDIKKMLEAEKRTMDHNPLDVGSGTRNLIIVIEELAELTQQLSKFLRGKEDHIGLIEEFADVTMALHYVKEICGITDDEINKAINVKIDRLQNTEGTYK